VVLTQKAYGEDSHYVTVSFLTGRILRLEE
jgi:hypothetical protein